MLCILLEMLSLCHFRRKKLHICVSVSSLIWCQWDQKYSDLIAGRPKAALLFWFFGDFRCGALLFMVIHVIYKYKNR